MRELSERVQTVKKGRLFSGLCDGCALAKMLRADLADAGLPTCDEKGRNYTFHGLRHGCAGRMARSGVPQATLQHFLRHESYEMTSKYYIDVNLDQMAKTIAEKSLALPLPQQSISSTTLANVPDNAGVNNSASKDNEIKDLGQGSQDSASTSDNNDDVYR